MFLLNLRAYTEVKLVQIYKHLVCFDSYAQMFSECVALTYVTIEYYPKICEICVETSTVLSG